MIAVDQAVSVVGAVPRTTFRKLSLPDQKHPAIIGWNLTTWFFDYQQISDFKFSMADLVTVRIRKVDDKNVFWSSEPNRSVCVDKDQLLLKTNGTWEPAWSLSPGTRLQHFCGNGHEAVVEGVEEAGRGEACDFVIPVLGSIIVAGVVLKAREPDHVRVG